LVEKWVVRKVAWWADSTVARRADCWVGQMAALTAEMRADRWAARRVVPTAGSTADW